MIPRPHVSASAVPLLVGALLLAGAPAASAASAASAAGHVPSRGADPARATAPGVYVVTLDAPPAGAYAGGVAGLRGTRPTDGARFDRTRPAVRAYTRWLLHRQDRVLARVGRPDLLYRYTTALDGFAASLTGRQVERLRRSPGVLRVERSAKQHIDRTPASAAVTGRSRPLLGLTGSRGAWAGHGGPASAGRGVVVGVVDSGIWPENPSFADAGPDASLPGFHGTCQAGERWGPADCTAKIVSARWFVRGFGEENTASAEFLSPRDGTGHGSHVASTAAGQDGVRVHIDGQRFGTTSGMAPASRLAVYKACWTAPEPADDGCTTADTVAAVDRAVSDGVDVLNYSVSGSQVRDDSVGRAFLGAATAGVFVATSAGNDARAGSVGHVAPWVTTVAASTYGLFEGTARLGDGTSYVGAMAADRTVPSTRLVLGGAIPAHGSSVAAARRCSAGSLDTAKAEGRVVVCERGGSPRVDKSTAVDDAGGVGMVLVDTGGGGVDADVHAVPTVHLDARAGAAVTAYVRRAGKRATVSLTPRSGRPAPEHATFSARGPAAADGGDVLKPDLTAPGVSVLGAVAPPSDSGRSWDLVSGTSTSAPHVAGLAALVAGLRPRWSPARVKSAMMTTAYDLTGRHGPLLEGAGHVDPTRLLDPGLVLDTDPSAWQRLAAGTVAARDVNAASLAVGNLVGHATVLRRITNVTNRRESYAARIQGMRGVDVQAFPATVRLAAGATRTVRLRITARPTARVDHDITGWLVWRGDRHRVRIPLSVHPTVVAAPEQVDGAGDRGKVVVSGRSGNGRTVKLRSTGLVAARTSPVRLQPRKPDRARPPAGPDVRTIPVPAHTDVARFAVAAGDLYVYRDGKLVASATKAPAEVTLTQPAPGDYRIYVAAAAGRTTAANGVLQTWVVPERGGSAVSLSTDAVGFAPGRRFRYSASWKDLEPGKHYLGVVSYGDSGRHTLVEVNRP